jgi:hypothetical protein
MTKGSRAAPAAMLLVAILAGCGGDDEADEPAPPVSGTFVGKVADADALIAVVTSRPAAGVDGEEVTVYVSDPDGTAELLSGSSTEDGFSAASEDGDVKAEGDISDETVSGTVELPGGEKRTYKATQATATAGLYDLTVSTEGDLRGASAAGVGLEGESTIPAPGSGTVKLADGTRLDFEIERGDPGEGPGVRAGGVRMIVLADGTLSGAAMSRPDEPGGDSEFFVLSARQAEPSPRSEG